MKYELIKEDEHSFHVKHPEGQSFTVAKAGLKPDLISKIKALKPVKLSDGGDVPDATDAQLRAITGLSSEMPAKNQGDAPDSALKDILGNGPVRYDGMGRSDQQIIDDQNKAITSSEANRSPASFLGDAAHAIGGGIHDVYDAWNKGVTQPVLNGVKDAATGFTSGLFGQPATAAQTPVASSPTAGQNPVVSDAQAQAAAEHQALMGANGGPAPASQNSAPSKPLSLPPDMQKAFNNNMAGIQANANAQSQQADSIGQAYKDYNAQIQQREAAYQERLKTIDSEQQNLMNKFASQEIDPKRVWHQASTGGKIMAGIGLLLSGMGSATTGQPNLAYETIQKTMDRDIDAQKANMDKTKSLFSMNMEKYKNAQMAEDSTRLQMLTALNAQVEQAKAQSGSLQAQANAKILQSQLQMQMAQIKQEMAKKMAEAQLVGYGGARGGLPVSTAMPSMLADPKTVQIGDRIYQTRDPKEAEELRTMQSNYRPVVNGLNALDSLGPKAAIKGTDEYNQAQVIRNALVFKVNELYGLKRLSAEDKETILEEIGNPGAFTQMLSSGVRNSTFKRILDDSMDSAYTSKLPGYIGTSRYSNFKQQGKVNGNN